MPLKIYILIGLIAFAGILIFSVLLIRLLNSFKKNGPWKRELLLIGIMTFVGLSLATIYIPCFSLTYDVTCHGPKNSHWIALSFDDGPNEPYTSQILDILKQEGVKATFFPLGTNIRRDPQVIQRMVKEGHAIGNHGFDHFPMALMNSKEIEREISGWEREVHLESEPPVKLFRAPHGWKTPLLQSILEKQGYHLIGWSRGVWDSDKPGAEVLFKRLTRRVHGGEIILLHDGEDIQVHTDRSQTVQVLPQVIHAYRALGYDFVTIPMIVEGLHANP